MAPPPVLPSVSWYGVGTPVAIISQLNTLPACAPVNASMVASRLATHDSGSGWLATPFLYDSFIHYSTPVYPGAHHGLLVFFIIGTEIRVATEEKLLTGRFPSYAEYRTRTKGYIPFIR